MHFRVKILWGYHGKNRKIAGGVFNQKLGKILHKKPTDWTFYSFWTINKLKIKHF